MIMEGFVCSPFSTYQGFRGSPTPGRGQDPAAKQPSWKQSKSGGISPFLGGPLTPLPSEYLDSYRRAQLQALLSQVSPGLAPLPRRASTKEAAVQVSLRADKAVQCSLGPRTLPPARAFGSAALRAPGRLALYSPAPDRRPFALPEAKASPNKAALSVGPAQETPTAADGREKQEKGPARAALPPRREPTGTRRKENAAPRQRATFQFLEQKYGYFHCKDCKTRWESAYVWCISGSNKVYFKQLCRKCQKGFNPYRVEAIQCQICSRTRCSCPQKKRHIDLKRPHRQELCGRCKGKRLSCDNTYSFKYIV
ncbi:ZAR1-like protein isoform X2 [Neopelma chrysocephalum]|uniref:ZAR1-like protein isoform X2 n=1 Tax=Neopelma chrysocephalum TaxID=114329 RepID=UPI000FCD0110|nr:ZAR1-like protein isoform X2 [Neopelma chrysocephalum]